MNGLSRISRKTLKVWRRRAAKQAAKKAEVMDRHKPDTPWHTRAQREYQAYSRRVEEIDTELSNRR